MKRLFYLFVWIFFLMGCSKGMESCFTITNGDDTAIKVNSSVKLISCSINAKSYEWDFGDGVQEANGGPTATYSYSAPGTYNITLTITNGLKKETSSRPVTIVQ